MKKKIIIKTLLALFPLLIIYMVLSPLYCDYTGRAQISEGLALAGDIQTGVAEYYYQNKTFPKSLSVLQIKTPIGKYTKMIVEKGTEKEGVVTIIYNETSKIPNDTKIILIAKDSGNGEIVWTCTASGTIAIKDIPSSCK